MRRKKTGLAGFTLIFLGIGAYGTSVAWLKTRTMAPVNIPISMAIGHVRTREFKVNVNMPYTIDIEVQKTIPIQTLNCLLGTRVVGSSGTFEDCPDQPPVIRASWLLTSDGQTVAKGSSDDHRYGDWMKDSVSRELGNFQSQSGRRYVLDVNLLADGSALALGNPRLKVKADPDPFWAPPFLSFVLFGVMIVLVLIGSILVFFAL
jgi:hypothetical protein